MGETIDWSPLPAAKPMPCSYLSSYSLYTSQKIYCATRIITSLISQTTVRHSPLISHSTNTKHLCLFESKTHRPDVGLMFFGILSPVFLWAYWKAKKIALRNPWMSHVQGTHPEGSLGEFENPYLLGLFCCYKTTMCIKK